MSKETITYYKFLSQVRVFLSKLMSNPIKAKTNSFFEDNDFTKKKLINILIKRGILERKEKILDSTNSEEKKAKYIVKYKIKDTKNFENKIREIYNDYFGEEINENKSFFVDEEKMKEDIMKNPIDKKAYMERGGIKECDCGGACGGTCGCEAGGATGCSCDGSGQYVGRAGFPMLARTIAPTQKKKKKGKFVTFESKKIHLTENQVKYIIEHMMNEEIGGATTTFSVGQNTTRGDIGYDTPLALQPNNKKDPTISKDGRSPENDEKSLYEKPKSHV